MSWLALVRAIHFAAAIQVIGAFLFIWIIRDAARTYACAAESTRSRVLVRLATISVLVTAVSGAAWFWLQVADMSEQSLTEVLDKRGGVCRPVQDKGGHCLVGPVRRPGGVGRSHCYARLLSLIAA